MLKLVLFALLGTTYGNIVRNEPANRFLAATRTTTVVLLSTTTVPTTVKRNCWTSAAGAAISQCRRRRGIEEQPDIAGLDEPLTDILRPTQVIPLETTRKAILREVDEEVDENGKETSLETSAEVEIQGAEECLGRSALGVTIYFTTSTTIVLTSLSSVTIGVATYQIASCFPSVVANDKC